MGLYTEASVTLDAISLSCHGFFVGLSIVLGGELSLSVDAPYCK